MSNYTGQKRPSTLGSFRVRSSYAAISRSAPRSTLRSAAIPAASSAFRSASRSARHVRFADDPTSQSAPSLSARRPRTPPEELDSDDQPLLHRFRRWHIGSDLTPEDSSAPQASRPSSTFVPRPRASSVPVTPADAPSTTTAETISQGSRGKAPIIKEGNPAEPSSIPIVSPISDVPLRMSNTSSRPLSTSASSQPQGAAAGFFARPLPNEHNRDPLTHTLPTLLTL
ncbi:predicted GPI-anchored protein 58 [Zingiber officinale]|uniref:predicted GPI-anchored protein 58 n=1 Tax=Zingiber officinale TaxID=94328 RepID=UPI001C4B50C0|nr:predicted GPI-anchored protein 58 [Zingiber officinale]